VRKLELRGLYHVNVQPEGYQHRYEAYIDGLCEAYTLSPGTVKLPPIVGSKEDHIIYLLELILQAIKEK
jgi:hypothetical protein